MLLTLVLALFTMPSGNTGLKRAISNGEDDLVIAALQKDPALLTPENKESSPLHWAAAHGRYKVVEAALALGVDVDLPNRRGQTALFEVLNSFDLPTGWRPTLTALLKAGADPNHLDLYGNSPLLAMFRGGSYRNRVLEPTRLKKADVSELMAMMALMQKAGADLWLKTEKGGDLLELSIFWGIRPMVPFLIKKLPDALFPQRLNDALVKTTFLARDARVSTMAVRENMARVILEAGAQTEAANRSLTVAAQWPDPMMLKVLLEHGADLTKAKGRSSASVLQNAFTRYRAKDDAVVTFLLEHGADITFRDSLGETALHYAVQHGSYSWIEALLARGAAFDDDEKGTPLLAVAMDNGNFEMAVYLIRKGAKWDGREFRGKVYADNFLSPNVRPGTAMYQFLHALIRWRAGVPSHLEQFSKVVFDPEGNIEVRRRWALYLMEAAPRRMAGRYIDLLEDKDEVLRKLAYAMLRRKALQYANEDVPDRPVVDPWKAWLANNEKALPQHVDAKVVRAGIGVHVSNVSIARVMPGQGAEMAGLRKGDKILAVDGVPVESYKRRSATIDWLLAGPVGAKVALTIAREGVAGNLEIEVTRTLLKTSL